MGIRRIRIAAWVLLLGGAAAAALGVLGVLGIIDAARGHHFAMLGGGIPIMTVAVAIFWMLSFKG